MPPMYPASLEITHHKWCEQHVKLSFPWRQDIFSLMDLKKIKVGFRDIPTLAFGPPVVIWASSILQKLAKKCASCAAMADLIFLW
mmetsp:Transcript_138448/g.195919  ORF Transcript_138448/g.195919 Transcript_138448/m.195919 type:complete len:85 (-) Transcript_138448:932-1186(-)